MKRFNLFRFSISGLVLLTASVVVSFFVPKNKKESNKYEQDGRNVDGLATSSVVTCVTAAVNFNCHNTATIGDEDTSSLGGEDSTNNSTAKKNTTIGDNS